MLRTNSRWGPGMVHGALLTLVLTTSPVLDRAAPVIVDAINDGFPVATGGWSAREIGWRYTPTQTFDLVFLQTAFGGSWSDYPVELWSAPPIEGGVLLRSGATAWTPIRVHAGQAYFVGFPRLDLVPGALNFTLVPGATSTPDHWYSFPFDPPSARYTTARIGIEPLAFLLRVYGDPVAVPEPATGMLVAAGLALFRRRFR